MEEESISQAPEHEEFDYHDIRVIRILMLVGPSEIEDKLTERLRELGARGILVTRGRGSARPGMLELLGFKDNPKSVVLAAAHDDTASAILGGMAAEFFTGRGTGFGFSIRAAGFAGARLLFKNLTQKTPNGVSAEKLAETRRTLTENAPQNEKKNEEENMPTENKLVMTVVNRGFSEAVMDAARDAGATGGTIVLGRGTGTVEKNLFGIRIEPEKEIVLIVTTNAFVKGIVETINEKVGLKTPGSGICFVLPVDEVVGLTPIDSGMGRANT